MAKLNMIKYHSHYTKYLVTWGKYDIICKCILLHAKKQNIK